MTKTLAVEWSEWLFVPGPGTRYSKLYNLYNRAGLAMCWYSTVLYFYLLSGLITVVQYSTVD